MVDKINYTISSSPDMVSVSEFRSRIDHLIGIVRVDSKACLTSKEVYLCVETAKVIGDELINTDCARATLYDWNRRENAIEESFNYITNNQ